MPCYTYYGLAILTMTLKVSPSSPLHAHREKSFSAAASNRPSCRGTWLGLGVGLGLGLELGLGVGVGVRVRVGRPVGAPPPLPAAASAPFSHPSW